MKVICNRCKKEFTLQRNMRVKYEKDGLCGKCRNRAKYLKEINRHRKTKHCPTCGKLILNISAYCNRCSQLGEKNHQWKDGHTSEQRVCKSCGSPITTGSGGLCAECYRLTLSGENNPNYKHGHYTGNFCSKSEYRSWKISVFERDDWVCKMCGERHRKDAQAHHIYPKRDYPDLVFDIDNGITLCPKCHEKTFAQEYQYIEYFLNINNRPNQNSVNSVNAEMPTPSQA